MIAGRFQLVTEFFLQQRSSRTRIQAHALGRKPQPSWEFHSSVWQLHHSPQTEKHSVMILITVLLDELCGRLQVYKSAISLNVRTRVPLVFSSVIKKKKRERRGSARSGEDPVTLLILSTTIYSV